MCPLNARLSREQGKRCQAEAGYQHVWMCFLHEMSLWVFFHREGLSPLLANCFFTILRSNIVQAVVSRCVTADYWQLVLAQHLRCV